MKKAQLDLLNGVVDATGQSISRIMEVKGNDSMQSAAQVQIASFLFVISSVILDQVTVEDE